MSRGFERAGHDIIAGVDYDEDAIETFDANHDARAIQCDLASMDPEDFAAKYDIHPEDVDGIGGGPPCQGFSGANHERSVDDPRNNLVFRFAEYVAYYQPEFLLMENVTGLKSIDDGETLSLLVDELEAADYTVEYKILNAADYGVPQKRKRVFVQGRKDDEVEWPELTHDTHRANVEDAFRGLPSLGVGEDCPEIANHAASNHSEKTRRRFATTDGGEPLYDSWNGMIRLEDHVTAPTMTVGGGNRYQFGHPSDDRALTIRERARLMSFTDDFVFEGGVTANRRLTGNAVPPKLAEAIASTF